MVSDFTQCQKCGKMFQKSGGRIYCDPCLYSMEAADAAADLYRKYGDS